MILEPARRVAMVPGLAAVHRTSGLRPDQAINTRLAMRMRSWRVVAAASLFAAVLVAGCRAERTSPASGGVVPGEFRSRVPRSDSLKSVQIGRADVFGNPWQIGATDDLLLVVDLEAPHLHVMEAATGRHIKSFGTGGDGPDALGNGPYLMRASLHGRSDSVRLLDGMNRRLIAIGTERLRSPTLNPELSIVRIASLAPIFADGPDRAGRILGIQHQYPGSSAPIWLDRATGRGEKGPWRSFPRADIDSMSIADAYSGRVCYSPHFDVLIQPFFWAGRIDVVTLDGTRRGVIETPFPFEPHVEPDPRRGGRMIFYGNRADVRQGYVDCAVTATGHYGLYDGHREGDGPPGTRLASEVHRFDRNGRFVQAYVLDHSAHMMAIPDGDSLVFTISEADSGFVVRKARLPKP